MYPLMKQDISSQNLPCFDFWQSFDFSEEYELQWRHSQSKFKTGVETGVVQFLILKGTFYSSFFTFIFKSSNLGGEFGDSFLDLQKTLVHETSKEFRAQSKLRTYLVPFTLHPTKY